MYATAVNTRSSVPMRTRSVYAMRARLKRGLGQSVGAAQLVGSVGGMAANALVPGSGAIVGPVVDEFAQLFQSNPVTGKDAEREAHIDTVYEEAMTSPGSSSSIAAVVELWTIANNAYDPIANIQQNNPQVTRTYAQEALNLLATQGWSNLGLNPVYTGVAASGQVLAVNPATGQSQTIANRALPSTGASLGVALSNPWVLLLGAAAVGGLVYAITD